MSKTEELLKEKLATMLRCFHSFCEDNGLTYYVVDGTALGAVRHKGFIPWDDDIDVGMPREDYDRFLALCNGWLSDIFAVESPESESKDFQYAYAKIYDTTTTLIESAQEPIVRGVYIDVFPLDGVGSCYNESVRYMKRIIRLQNLLFAKICSVSRNRKVYKNAAIVLCRFLPVNAKKLVLKIDSACRKRAYADYDYVAIIAGNLDVREIMQKDIYGKPTKYFFENTQVYGPEKIDAYLSALYGDYMTLPPVEKQKSHHNFIKCDLNESYLNLF